MVQREPDVGGERNSRRSVEYDDGRVFNEFAGRDLRLGFLELHAIVSHCAERSRFREKEDFLRKQTGGESGVISLEDFLSSLLKK